MMTESDILQALVNKPQESLKVELKTWLDPEDPFGIAKIVKALIAMRNHDGGFLVMGFDDQTTEPDLSRKPANQRTYYHIDKLQPLVGKYASEPFNIEIHFPERDSVEFPVIEVEKGIRSPVAAKRDLPDPNDQSRYLIRKDRVYVRSLRANNTVSTTEAKAKDWPHLVEICFNNREADIGRFLRRHLGGITSETIRHLADTFATASGPDVVELVRQVLNEGVARFEQRRAENSESFRELPDSGFLDVAVVIDGDLPTHRADREFLHLLQSSNPRLTGWPVWFIDIDHPKPALRPRVMDGAWEELLLENYQGWLVEFWRLDPRGRFFLRRGLEDDFLRPARSGRQPEPLKELDFLITTLRVAEAMAVALRFTEALDCDPEKTKVEFLFRWTRLKGRQLSSWADPRRFLFSTGEAYNDEHEEGISLPLDLASGAIGQYVHHVVSGLFALFDAPRITVEVVTDIVDGLFKRTL